MGKIKNIIFDFGVVLINLERERFLNNFKAIGVKNIESLLRSNDIGKIKIDESGETRLGFF